MESLSLTSGGSPFRLATWNAHSVYNRRSEVESLLHTHELEILGVTESWLRPGDVWELPKILALPGRQNGGPGRRGVRPG